MTCKNCIYEPMCHNVIAYGMDTDDVTVTLITDIEKHCKHFKDKSRAIVPPCKVGAELYCVYSPPRPANPADKGKWYMNKFEVARFHYGVKGLSIEMYGYGTVNENEIGKTVFFNREEAEKALAEREGAPNAGDS